MKLEDLNQYESYRNWMSSLPGPFNTGSTKYVWSKKLLKYCEWIGRNPDELIAGRKADLKSEDPTVQHRAELKLKEFMRALEQQGFCRTTEGYSSRQLETFMRKTMFH